MPPGGAGGGGPLGRSGNSAVAEDRFASVSAVGILCGRSSRRDVVDVHVALHATAQGHLAVSSDPDDLHSVVPSLPIIEV